MTAPRREGRCFNCGATREACEARTARPLFCCPTCLRRPAFGAHVRPIVDAGPDNSADRAVGQPLG